MNLQLTLTSDRGIKKGFIMQDTGSNNTVKNVLVDEPITREEQERLNRKEFAKLNLVVMDGGRR